MGLPPTRPSSLARELGLLSLSMVLGGSGDRAAHWVLRGAGCRQESVGEMGGPRCPAPAHSALSPWPCPCSLPTPQALHRGLWRGIRPQIVLTQPNLQSYNIYVPPGDALCLVSINSQVSSSEFKVIRAKMMPRSREGTLGLSGTRGCWGKCQGLAALLAGLLLCARFSQTTVFCPHRPL